MARRKDHTPGQLRTLICSEAEKLIHHKGLDGLTARALAEEIGYTPGTIYNFYKDMDALVIDINFETMGHLYDLCQKRIEKLPPNFSKIKALAYAYVDFAHDNTRAWETVFATTRKGDKKVRLPKHYQARLLKLFSLIEFTLEECLNMPNKAARSSARLLWACMHGITVLTLDGRLNLVGVQKPHDMIDDLLQKYLVQYL
jgi:AcrR family transcriptional regulator